MTNQRVLCHTLGGGRGRLMATGLEGSKVTRKPDWRGFNSARLQGGFYLEGGSAALQGNRPRASILAKAGLSEFTYSLSGVHTLMQKRLNSCMLPQSLCPSKDFKLRVPMRPGHGFPPASSCTPRNTTRTPSTSAGMGRSKGAAASLVKAAQSQEKGYLRGPGAAGVGDWRWRIGARSPAFHSRAPRGVRSEQPPG